MTRGKLIKELAEKLYNAGLESSRFEASQIVATVAGRGAEDSEVPPKQEKRALEMLAKRLDRQPLQYILGEWEFCGITFKVGPGVLIPRQDTELLVETALPILKNTAEKSVFDLCAGSGCIGTALAKLTDADVTFFEKSDDALRYLKENLRLNGVSAEVRQCDVLLLPPDGITADMIVCNPPYIRSDVVKTLEPEVKREPITALDGGRDGLTFYRSIAVNWKSALKRGGCLIFEIGFDQEKEVVEIMKTAGFSDVSCKKDLCGNPRVVLGYKF